MAVMKNMIYTKMAILDNKKIKLKGIKQKINSV